MHHLLILFMHHIELLDEKFPSEKNQETYEKLNLKRNIWAERKVLSDELDPEIRRNFERRDWLPLLDISHPPSATLLMLFSSLFLFTEFCYI